ncbi:pleiotropic regulatory protein [Aquipluma nitroreducens]|uniref:Pleiotropic regulatory protein n=2 Tax=Aquipluma nitroreducens TaxID=2010828 RepID=A0A5K7S3Y2_9BACT|nr:pleiotropic regulatory protein [Aquipluma nitroreducens]
MVDLQGQYHKMQNEIDQAVLQSIRNAAFINGPEVKLFQKKLEDFTGSNYVIPCANGTDALQIALMALNLSFGDEVIVPAFTYVATAEVIALLGLIPVMVDVDARTFNIDPAQIEKAITSKTRAIVPVHLFGQCSDMKPIMQLAEKYKLWVIEDNAQSLGSEYTFKNGVTRKTGAIGHIGCTSFFPTKNLGCYGDGGAITTDNEDLAIKLRMIANHGQKVKYHHSVIGCNSRLDTVQASVLNVKLNYLSEHLEARRKAANSYTEALKDWPFAHIPETNDNVLHTYNQYTLIVKNGYRNELKAFLAEREIPTMIYYPLPLYRQEAFKRYAGNGYFLTNTEDLCQSVLSIPIHTELNEEIQSHIISKILEFNPQ